MTIVLLNLSGNVGKSTLAKHLLKPRIPSARIYPVETINTDAFEEATVASNLKVRAEVTTPPSSPKVNPMKNVKITFPKGMTFRPNN